jgi:predicted anti-sigma-YlaC factor YlaD
LKNGVASLAYDPVVHSDVRLTMDCRIKSGNDELRRDDRAVAVQQHRGRAPWATEHSQGRKRRV